MRNLLVSWLQGQGYDVTACRSGSELLAQLERSVLSEELPGFEVVLSDIHMPLGSAFDVLEEFYGFAGVPPTILITAFGSPRTRETARRLGAAVVLEKPFERGQLLAEIQRLRSAEPNDASSAAPVTAASQALPNQPEGGTR